MTDRDIKQDGEMNLGETLKAIIREPLEATVYAGKEPETRFYQIPLKVRFADMFWAVHGTPLWGKEGYIGLIKGVGYFDLITALIFRIAILLLQWSRDTLTFKFADSKHFFGKLVGKIYLAICKVLAIPVGIIAFFLHVLGNFIVRPIVSVCLAAINTIIPVIFIAEYMARNKSEKLSKENIDNFDREIEIINNKPASRLSIFSFSKKEPAIKLELLGPQLEREKVLLKNCYLKKQVEKSKKSIDENYLVCDAYDRIIANYPHNKSTEKLFNQFAFNLFKLSQVQRKKINLDKNHPEHDEASLERRGQYRCSWFE